MKAFIVGLILALIFALACFAGDDRRERNHKRERSHNYIIERQQIGAVRGVPTSRRIIGKREIDIYPNGLMFERNSVVGVAR